MRAWVAGGEGQVGGEGGEVGREAVDGGGGPLGVGGGEALGPFPHDGDGGVAGRGPGVVEQRPERLLDLGLVLDGHLGQDVAARWMRHLWRRL
jgi:hypothetical protein